MFYLSSISNGVEFWLVNHTSIFENAELDVFKNIKLLGEISNNWSNDLLEINIYKTLESLLLTILQWTNTTLGISKLDTFSLFSS